MRENPKDRFEKCQGCDLFRPDLIGEECQHDPETFNPENCPVDEVMNHLKKFQKEINDFGDRLEKLHDDYWDMLNEHERFLRTQFILENQSLEPTAKRDKK